MLEKVKKNEYGFYELVNKPTAEEQKKRFEEEYYQDGLSKTYEVSYTEEEKAFLFHKIEQKMLALKRAWGGEKKARILDVGCGEGFLLKKFKDAGYDVLGIDFSRYGIENQNPELLPYFVQGDCYEKMQELIEKNETFDLINMDAVLDMVQDPEKMLQMGKRLLKKDGIFACKVANNYSEYQLGLLKDGTVTKEYWLDEEGHSWYFNKDGLITFFEKHGYMCKDIYAEGLIEFFLLNSQTNYYENPQVGKSCYQAKVRFENMLHEMSPEGANEVMRAFGKMGLGRELVGLFTVK